MAQPNVDVLKVFVACPGDLLKEKRLVERVLGELNATLGARLGIRLESVRAETHTYPSAGRAQQVILDQISPSKCDLFVGILWQRFGSPTGKRDSRTRDEFQSGTQEEFEVAYKSWKTTGRPKILFYRCTRSKSPKDLDPKQLDRVDNFLRSLSRDKARRLLYAEYSAVPEFEKLLRTNVAQLLNDMPARRAPSLSSLNEQYRADGWLDIFTPATNAQRDAAKADALRTASELLVVAHSGFAYLAQAGHRFRQILEDRLHAGVKCRFLLLDPWCEAALELALAEQPPANGRIRREALPAYCRQILTESAWFRSKHTAAIDGYRDLRGRFGQLIEVRFSALSMPATILLTSDRVFFEPYIAVDMIERLRMEMITFEVGCSNESSLYKHCQRYGDSLWRHATLLDDNQADLAHRREAAFQRLSSTMLSVLQRSPSSGIQEELPLD